MKHTVASLALAVLLVPGATQAADHAIGESWVAPQFGTLGVGLEVGTRWNDRWGARGSINGVAMRFVHHDRKSDLHNRLALLNAGGTLDYYPYEGDFRLSGGVRLSANRIEGRVRNAHQKQRFNGGTLTVIVEDPLTRYTVRQNALQPYLGIGYSKTINERVTLDVDFGALYTGTPGLKVRSEAERFGFTERQIEREIDRARNRLSSYRFMPVVQLGFKIAF